MRVSSKGLLVPVVLAAGALSAPQLVTGAVAAPTAPTTYRCGDGTPAGTHTYLQRRQFVDAQGWWLANPGAPAATMSSGHVHLGACIPDRETVHGPFKMLVKVQMHEHGGSFLSLNVTAKGNGFENKVAGLKAGDGFLEGDLATKGAKTWAGDPEGNTYRWFPVLVDPATDYAGPSGKVSGLQEVRLRAFTKAPDGNNFSSSLIFTLNVDNGPGAKHSDYARETSLRGKGFYDDGTGPNNTSYCESSLLDPVPDDTVSLPWTPRAAMSDHATAEPDRAVSANHVYVDRNAHAGLAGITAAESRSDFPAANPAVVKGRPVYAPLRITAEHTGGIPGLHKLQLKTDCDFEKDRTQPMKPHLHVTMSGVLVVPFTTK
jgi:hypothetical protein